jgi:tetratricopeptide (TPR) repeat protein
VATEAGEIVGVAAALDSARLLMDQGKPAAAEAILRAGTRKFPADQSLVLLLGECLLQQGRGEEAYEAYSQGIMIGPDNAEYRHAAATIASQLGRTEEAEAHYAVGQKLAPSNPKFPLYRAQVQRALGRVGEARANLLLATKLDPDLAIAWASLAAIALDENRPTVAREYIERSRKLEPARLEWRVIEARALRREGKPREAAELLLAVPVSVRGADEAALMELALSLGLLERAGEAAELYVAALELDAGNAELAYQAALWLERAGQRGRAETYAASAASKGHAGAKELAARLGAAGQGSQER